MNNCWAKLQVNFVVAANWTPSNTLRTAQGGGESGGSGLGLFAGGSPTKQLPPSSAAIYGGGGGKSSAEKMSSGIDGDSWRLPSNKVFTVFLDFHK
jgi:hypothetical protein